MILFLLITFMMTTTFGESFDEKLATWAEGSHAPWLESLMKSISLIGSSEAILLLTVLIGAILLLLRKWRHLIFFFVVSVGGVILNLALKLVIQRARPGDEAKYIDVFNYQFELQSYSFPSGHTMRATIFFLFVIYLVYYALKTVWIKWVIYAVSSILILAIPFSRMILDAHFFTDVFGALLVAVAWFFLSLFFFYKPKETGNSLFISR